MKSHFAEINNDGIVQRVIVIDQVTLNTGRWGSPHKWIETSKHTRGGKHYDNSGIVEDFGIPLRYNYAGIGYTYDQTRDAFIAPKPYPSWLLDESTCIWDAPTPYPDDGKKYYWDEDSTSWKEIE